ncbi:hypothetical protein CISIN_1g033763mg [Citrus sinensis]|uniref:Succinate dehydrogenase assembly factor 4, mitochondrial n=1 Tax=Citrus sinensis TaxID=2711 RepID=A0A067EL84_CITSI|nr:hypothetical protein CISIN_1g033763mg [Citrus sinensis]
MARNNLGRIFASIADLSAPPKLSPPLVGSSNSVSRLIRSSSSTRQENSPVKEPGETVKSNQESEEIVDDRGDENEEDTGDFVNKDTGEVGGPRGPEPTRYGDWERNGRCYDF